SSPPTGRPDMPLRLPEADAPPAHSPATGFAAYAVSPETARRAPHLHPAALPPPRAPYPGYGPGYSPNHGASHGAGEISLADLMATLATGKWTILVCTLLAMLAGSLWFLGTPPAYRAEALLQLEKRAGGLALP